MIKLKHLLEDFDIEAHLRERGVDPSKTKVIMDMENGIATFMLYNLSGQAVGYQRYNPRGDKKDHSNSLAAKYYTYITKESPKIAKLAVWGTENIDPRNPYLFVTEGIFDANKLKNAGYPAIAVLTNNPEHLRPWFKILNKKIVAIVDKDSAGSKLKKYADQWFEVPDGFKDLGEMPQKIANEFLNGVSKKLENYPRTAKTTHSFSKMKVTNPKTGNDILVKTALNYGVEHPAYRAAKSKLMKAKSQFGGN